MTQQSKKTVKQPWFYLVAWLSLSVTMPPSVKSQPDEPLSVGVTMVTPSSIVQGEPIILHYEVTNNTGTRIDTREGDNHKGWYTVQVTDETGRQIKPMEQNRPLFPWEQGAQGMSVDAHQSQQGYIVPAYRFPHPGKFILSLRTQLPYGLSGDPNLALHKDSESMFTDVNQGDFSFPIFVAPADAVRIQDKALGLEKTIATEGNVSRIRALTAALCSMPEALASVSWQALADDPKASLIAKAELAKQMVSLHTSKSVDILADMAWSPDQPFGEFHPNSNNLTRAYLVGDDRLKQYIKDLYAQHGVPFPEHPTVTDITD